MYITQRAYENSLSDISLTTWTLSYTVKYNINFGLYAKSVFEKIKSSGICEYSWHISSTQHSV